MNRLFVFMLYFCLAIPTIMGYADNDGRSRIWTRVEDNGINHKLYKFLAEQDIKNCYEYREEPRLLRLRCLTTDHYNLFDVDIHVYHRSPQYLDYNYTDFHNPSVQLVHVSM